VTGALSRSEARRIALAAQGFGARRRPSDPGWRRLRGAIERMGLLQLDSINTVVRSHYLPLFSRLGPYDMATLDAKAFDPRRRALVEYWGHEASLLPLHLHPLLRWRMARAERLEGLYSGIADFVRAKRDYVDGVRDEITRRGPSSARDFNERGAGKGMWDWHDGKTALEYLFWSGQVTAVTRRGFERIYDLTERALPAAILDRPTPPEDEAQRALLRIAARALGVATEADLRDYFRLSSADARARLPELVEDGAVVPVRVEGWRQPAYLDPDARVPRRIEGSALLSPFDPLVWERGRTERLFGFRYRIEIYTPAAKRRYGYYVLPFLLDGHLVARVDLKADRAAGALRVLAAHAEDMVEPGRVCEALAAELHAMTAWLGLESLAVENRGALAGPLAHAAPTRRS
jgi:uncharacterized protein YcaQ